MTIACHLRGAVDRRRHTTLDDIDGIRARPSTLRRQVHVRQHHAVNERLGKTGEVARGRDQPARNVIEMEIGEMRGC